MKINEVEALAGITKKNIRFYEEQGLLTPRRNAENGYRDYSDADVAVLRQIRLLRKLGLPIEEIRQMLNGTHTVGDGMRRHLISLEREQRNLEQSAVLCRELQNMEMPVSALDTETILARMEDMERGGTSFPDSQAEDIRVQFVAPVVITAVVVALMAGLCALMFWGVSTDPAGAPPLWIVCILMAFFVSAGAGSVIALILRIREIQKGEINDARRY